MKLATTLLAGLLAISLTSLGIAQDASKPVDSKPASAEKGGDEAKPRPNDRPRRNRVREAGASRGAEVGKPAPEFTLKSVDGTEYTLAMLKGKTVVIEWFSPYCPVSAGGDGSYWGSGNASKVLAAVKAADADAVYLTVNSTKDGFDGKSTEQNGIDSTAAIKAQGQSVPVLLDADGKVGRAYGAKTTPHIFIVDAKGTVAYIGAPMSDDGATDYVTNAVTALKAGKPVEPSHTKNKGCSIKYAAPASPETPAAPAT